VNTTYHREKADKLIRLCAQNPNMSMNDLALAVGISRRTLQRWISRGLESKSGKYLQLVEAIQKSRAQLRVFVAGKHHVLAVGGTLQTPKKRVLLDDHNRPYVDPNNEVERRWSGGDPKCDHADHDLGQCPCGAIGEIVYIETAVLPNAANLQWEMERLMPEQNPSQRVEHHGTVNVGHRGAEIVPAQWMERLGQGFAILREANLDPAFMDRKLVEFAESVPGASGKQVDQIKEAIKQVSERKAIETTALPISDLTDYWIELEKDGAWHRVGEQSAHAPENACRGFLSAFCAGRFPDEPERAKKYAIQMLSKVRAVPKTVEGAT
jgi:hypothetical protein